MSVTDLSRFSEEQRRAALGLIDFLADRLPDPSWELAVRNGLDSLAREAQKLWPAVQSGEAVKLGVEHLHGAFNGLATDAEQLEFIEHAGYILLNGQDGPVATAAPMRNTIDFLVTRHKGEG